MIRSIPPVFVCLFLGVGLAACAAHSPAPPPPLITADSVLAVQYRATGRQGAMTGEEADHIHQTYLQKMGAADSGSAPDTMKNDSREDH